MISQVLLRSTGLLAFAVTLAYAAPGQAQVRTTTENTLPYPGTGIFMTSVNYPQIYGYYVFRPGGMVVGPPLTPGLERFPAADTRRDSLPIRVDVNCPADAEVWFNGTRTFQAGTYRTFVSPSMAPGRVYAYEIRARWEESGRPITWRRDYEVSAGDRLLVDVGAPAAPDATAPSRSTLRAQPLPDVPRRR